MRNTYALLFLLVLTGSPVQAMDRSQADTLVAQANRAYAAGEHGSALVLFDSVNTVFTSPSLLYNIGNCHFKLNDIPHAILFYERALRLAPGDEEVQANLDLARQNVVDRVNELPGFTLGSTWGELRGGRDADHWARRSLWASALLFLLIAGALIVRQRSLRSALVGAAAIALIGTLLSVAFAAYRHQEVLDDSAAIIMTAKVDVRSEPRDASTVLFVLHKGTKVSILQEENGWLEVKLSNGNVGWMPPRTLERI